MINSNIQILSETADNLDEEDWNNISKFMKEFPNRVKRSFGPEYYKNKLLNSPYGLSYITRVIDKSGYCLGLTTLTRKLFVVDGKKYLSFELGDSFVTKKLQGKSIYSKILSSALLIIEKNEKPKFIYSTPNSQSMHGLLKRGFELSEYKIYSRLLPLNVAGLFQSSFIKILLKFFISIYIYIIKVLLKIFSKNNDISIKSVEDLIKIEDKHISTNQIEHHRSHDYLKWRYFKNPDKYIMYAIYHRKNYMGYIVFKEGIHKKALALYLVDIFIKKKHISFTRPAICRTLLLNDLKKYAFVSTWISRKSTFWKDISSCFPIKNKNIPFIIHKKLSDDIFLNKNNKTIHFVLGDGDNI